MAGTNSSYWGLSPGEPSLNGSNWASLSAGAPSNDSAWNSSGPGFGSARASTHNLTLRYITLTFYLFTMAFGLFGNSLVLYVIARYSKVRQRSVANYYIWNLALADELFILTLPFFCTATFAENWPFGTPVCKLAFVFRECNKFVSVYTLVALSLDRYLATHPSLGWLRTIPLGKGVCVGIWLACMASVTPYWIYSYTVTSKHAGGVSVCMMNWPGDSMQLQKLWTYLQLVLGLLLPLTIIVVSNICLLVRLRGMVRPGSRAPPRRESAAPGAAGGGVAGGGGKTASTSRGGATMTKTILTIVVIFTVCQVPYHVIEVMRLVPYARGERPSPLVLNLLLWLPMVSQFLVFTSSCCNPIVYGFLNRNYRDLYAQVLCCCRKDPSRYPSVLPSKVATVNRRSVDVAGDRDIGSKWTKQALVRYCCLRRKRHLHCKHDTLRNDIEELNPLRIKTEITQLAT